MNVLLFINSYIKYLYIALVIVLIVFIVKTFKKLGDLADTANLTLDKTDGIYDNLNELKEKIAVVDNSMKTSVPFFRNIIVGTLLIGSVLKDYHETKNSKRSLSKSFKKIYKYRKKLDPNFSLAKLGSSLLKPQNR